VAGVLAIASLAIAAPLAHATNRVYWTNFGGGATVPFANLDGSGTGGNVNPGTAMINEPAGVALDPATNTVYWANAGAGTINFAKLDGTGGGGTLNTSPITPSQPFGLSLDAATGKIYWADDGDSKIEFANLNGTGGGAINTGSAPVNGPAGVAVDDATGKIYWANCGGTTAGGCTGTGTGANTIAFANLNGTGGGTLSTAGTPGVTPNEPVGVAIDANSGQIFWADLGDNKIEFANLNNTGGGGTLNTTPVAPNDPRGVAIDPVAGKLYWGDFGGQTIGVANINNTGDNVVSTSGETPDGPVLPALLEVPVGAGAPAVSGGTGAPSTLTCSQGKWAGDRPEALLYDAPQSFSFGWTDNGTAIAGATSSTLAVSAGGNYACVVTAHNQAGTTSQSSAPVAVAPTVQVGGVATSGRTATLTLTCEGVTGQTCSGSIAGTATEHKRGNTILAVSASAGAHKKPKPKTKAVTVKVASASYSIAGGQTTRVRVPLNATGGRLLAKFYRLPVQLAVSGSISVTKTITYSYPRLRPAVHPFWTWTNVPCSPCFTTVDSLTVAGVTKAETVTLRCTGGGCPFGKKVTQHHRGQLTLTKSFAGAHLAPGAKVQVAVTAPNSVGFVRIFTIVTGALPHSANRCMPPGSSTPTRCA
jgi:DNA-binding beta-propeller fold protein YncE